MEEWNQIVGEVLRCLEFKVGSINALGPKCGGIRVRSEFDLFGLESSLELYYIFDRKRRL